MQHGKDCEVAQELRSPSPVRHRVLLFDVEHMDSGVASRDVVVVVASMV